MISFVLLALENTFILTQKFTQNYIVNIVVYIHNFSVNSYVIEYSMSEEHCYSYLLFLPEVSYRIQDLRYKHYIHYL